MSCADVFLVQRCLIKYRIVLSEHSEKDRGRSIR